MIGFTNKLAKTNYPKEASELNKLVIKLKKEVMRGNITTISVDEIDEATIPALNVLRSQRQKK